MKVYCSFGSSNLTHETGIIEEDIAEVSISMNFVQNTQTRHRRLQTKTFSMNTAKLISVTPDAEKHMGYVARVSNPNNQDNPKVAGLLKYWY